jgi:hypothetical protein
MAGASAALVTAARVPLGALLLVAYDHVLRAQQQQQQREQRDESE